MKGCSLSHQVFASVFRLSNPHCLSIALVQTNSLRCDKAKRLRLLKSVGLNPARAVRQGGHPYWYRRYVSRPTKSNITMYAEIKMLTRQMMPLIPIPRTPPNLYKRTIGLNGSIPLIDSSIMVTSRMPLKGVVAVLGCCICFAR
jgi:hypothetical protein